MHSRHVRLGSSIAASRVAPVARSGTARLQSHTEHGATVRLCRGCFQPLLGLRTYSYPHYTLFDGHLLASGHGAAYACYWLWLGLHSASRIMCLACTDPVLGHTVWWTLEAEIEVHEGRIT
jgi:hypothetical protein